MSVLQRCIQNFSTRKCNCKHVQLYIYSYGAKVNMGTEGVKWHNDRRSWSKWADCLPSWSTYLVEIATGGKVVVGGRVLEDRPHGRRCWNTPGGPGPGLAEQAANPGQAGPLFLHLFTCVSTTSPPAPTPLASTWCSPCTLPTCTCGPERLQSGRCSYYPTVLYFMNRKEAAAARTDAESLQECQLPADHLYFCHLIINISVSLWSVFLSSDHQYFRTLMICIFVTWSSVFPSASLLKKAKWLKILLCFCISATLYGHGPANIQRLISNQCLLQL